MTFIPVLVSFLLVALLVPVLRYMAVRFGFVDTPDERKLHDMPVPPIGGLIIFPVFIALNFVFGASLAAYWPLYAGLFLLLGVGAWDDYKHCPPWPKFTAQILAATTIVVLGDVRIVHLGNIFGFGELGLNIFSVPFSITAIVLFINAVNLMDGLDGLAGGYGFVILTLLAVITGLQGYTIMSIPLYIILGALGGFLVHNMRSPVTPRARIFLGDSGSLALGLTVAWFTIHLGQVNEATLIRPMVVAWMLALPIMDTCAQFYRRVCEGRHPFDPDRGHFHHHFVDAGVSVPVTVLTILGLVFVTSAGAYLWVSFGGPEVVLTLLWILALFGHMALSRKQGAYTKIIQTIFKSSYA